MIRLKIYFFLFLLLSCNSYLTGDENQEIDLTKYQNIISTLITNMNGIVQGNSVSEIVYQTFITSEEAIRNNKVTFKIDPQLDGVLRGMFFSMYDSGEISLIFGLKYLDTYKPGSSIHYSILIHEYRHLYDYIRLGDTFKNAKNDEKEAYWYELDALRIEAEFIKHYLVEKYSLSRFERFLLNSFENDYLNVASTVLLRESMNLFFYFDRLENRYLRNEISKEEIIKELEEKGWVHINGYYEDNGEFINYGRFIEISTFRKYLTRILIRMNDNPEMTWGELFAQYPKIEEIYNTMSDILSRDNAKHTVFLDSLRDSFENEFVN